MRGMFEIIMKRMDDIEEGIKELKVDKGMLAEKIERMVIGWGEEEDRRKNRGIVEKDYGARKGGGKIEEIIK